MTSIENKRVLVVGGSSGIGYAVAAQAAAAGAKVTIVSRSQAKLADAAQRLGRGVAFQVLDTGNAGAVESFFQGQEAWDHIVVSAAQTPTGPLRALSLEDGAKAMDSKFWGAYRIARAAKFSERASLTFISGFLSERPSPNSVLQGAINAALESLARGLSLEFSPVRVNSVSPGMIDTPLWSKMDDAARQSLFERVAESVPAKVMGQPEDIANAVMFLMTTPFATGSTVRVDGGGAIA
jgi:NAD(P)-dependent dehydrogenase (short-subunit alcohol dehydrogenase family)